MKKVLLSALIIPALFLSTVTTSEASTKVMWGKTELVKGQIGKVTVLNPIQLYQSNNDGNFKQSTRSLKIGDEFRVYSYKGQDGGYYGLGGGLFVKKSTVVKYKTPSKAKLKLLEDNSNPPTSSEKFPVVAKELFKLYFESDATKVWNYCQNNDIPEHFTVNGRKVEVTSSSSSGAIVFKIGRKQ